jgi:phospholipid/cholesterol/gamma-HCH transport system substrate-binding protein
MLSRRVRLQIGAFIVIGLLCVSYISVRYVGLLRVFGLTGYSVTMELPFAGGLFNNAEVTYRGVPVGRVQSMQLTASGIQVKLHIDSSSTKIPSDLAASVADRSVIGEQYVDLMPRTTGAPYLHAGSQIAQADTSTPTSTTTLLTSAQTLLNSVPIPALQTTVTELSAAFQNTAPDLQRLLTSTETFYTAAAAALPATDQLLAAGRTVLATQVASSQEIEAFSASLREIGLTFQQSDESLNQLIQVSPGAAAQIGGLFADLDQPLALLLTNLTTTADVFQANVGGLQTILVRAPQAIDVGNHVITSSGADVGLALTFFQPLPCTSGYGATVRRSPLVDPALNTSVGCSATTAGSDVRGAQAAAARWAGPVDGTPSAATAPSLASLMGAP